MSTAKILINRLVFEICIRVSGDHRKITAALSKTRGATLAVVCPWALSSSYLHPFVQPRLWAQTPVTNSMLSLLADSTIARIHVCMKADKPAHSTSVKHSAWPPRKGATQISVISLDKSPQCPCPSPFLCPFPQDEPAEPT